MSRFLIASWDGGGNTPSAYNLGSRLVRRGHRVRMMGWHAMAAPAAAAGLENLGLKRRKGAEMRLKLRLGPKRWSALSSADRRLR